jgi:hypothetical protein
MHLSCVKISTISKWTESSFHLSLVTKECHWVRTKWFLSLWYVWRKLCTYLESRLVLSLNRSKRASTWASSPRSTIRGIQNNYLTNGMFGANCAPILHWHEHRLQMDRNVIWHDPCHLAVPSGASKMISDPILRSAQTVYSSCVKINTISKWTEMSFYLSLVNLVYHRVRPKWFLTLWYVWRKPCT